MRLPHRLASALFVCAFALVGSDCIPQSKHLEVVPHHGACDVIVRPGNQAATLALLNDPTKRVFCVDPGDYRSAGALVLSASGSSSARRFLRFNAPNPLPKAVHLPAGALFESLQVEGSWWVIQGITVRPRAPETRWLLSILGGDRNVVDGNLIDASEQWNDGSQVGILIGSSLSDPATYNSVQSNVVRSGNRSRRPIDYTGVAVSVSVYAGGNNDYNEILDNEIYDWGDGVALTAGSAECSYAGRPRGTLIDGNDIYVTAANRADCATGSPDPDGDCSCSENGIDVKSDPGSSNALWTRITNNRLWGFRPTAFASCGGSGSNGQAISAGNDCAGHLFVAGNIIQDSTSGISVRGTKWTIVRNLFHEIRKAPTAPVAGGIAILPVAGSGGLEVQFNTIASVDNAYDDASDNTDTRCNVVLDDLALNGFGSPRGSQHSTRYNYLYHAPWGSIQGSTNRSFASEAQSRNQQLCFWRKRWTGLEQVCIPHAQATPQSPHQTVASSCESNLGSPFGFGPLGFL